MATKCIRGLSYLQHLSFTSVALLHACNTFNTGFVTIEAALVDLRLKIHKLNINPYSSGHMNNSAADIMSINGYNFKHCCKILKGLLVLNNNFQASFQPK